MGKTAMKLPTSIRLLMAKIAALICIHLHQKSVSIMYGIMNNSLMVYSGGKTTNHQIECIFLSSKLKSGKTRSPVVLECNIERPSIYECGHHD